MGFDTRKRKYSYKKTMSNRRIQYSISKPFNHFQKIHTKDFENAYTGIKHTTLDPSISDNLKKQTNVTMLYSNLYTFLHNYFTRLCSRTSCKEAWVKCKSDCFKKSYTLLETEIKSTLYILNLLGNSYLSIHNTKLVLLYDNAPLTGKWEDDSKHFRLSKTQFLDGRLIMGFGPSASGKTYWAKSIIKLLSSDTTLNFPTDFLSIDGGIQRETSVVYQIVKNIIKDFRGSGISNLVSTSLLSNSLFSSDKIKKILKDYLIDQSVKPNLYVPETLGGCLTSFSSCSKKYKDYVNITQDKEWVGIYIWQHKDTCNLPNGYKCKTVTKSGKTRQIDEGKKYSSNAYFTSEYYGNMELFRKSGDVSPSKYQIRIHNSGGSYIIHENKKIYNKSIVELDESLYKHFLSNKQNIELQFNCVILPMQKEYMKTNPDNFNLQLKIH